MRKPKVKEECVIPVVELVNNHGLTLQDQYTVGLSRIVGEWVNTANVVDKPVPGVADLWVGMRDYQVANDGFELYAYGALGRHSLMAIEFPRHGGVRVIIHIIQARLIPKHILSNLPRIYHAMVLNALFPGHEIFVVNNMYCMRYPNGVWLPMKLTGINPRHYALLAGYDVNDNEHAPQQVGMGMPRDDRWHTRLVDIVATPPEPSELRLSSLHTHRTSTLIESRETVFDPDVDVCDIDDRELVL